MSSIAAEAHSDGNRQDILVIDGMFCAGCAASVEATLRKQPGVNDASVNFAADAAVLDWNGETANDILASIAALGYDARFVGDQVEQKRERQDPARQFTLRLIIAVFFGMWTMLPSIAMYTGVVDPQAEYVLAWAAGILSLPVVLYSGLPFYRMGIATLRTGVAGIDALVFLGVIGSLVLSGIRLANGSGEVYFEVPVALITLQLIARLLDLRVRRRARDAVLSMLDLAPSTLTLLDAHGNESEVSLREAPAGSRVRVRPGSRLAIDGQVVEGEAELDRSLFNGESAPLRVGPGAFVHAGERVLDAALIVEVSASAGKRRIDGLAKQVRQSLAKKPAWQRIADLAARYFIWLSAVAAIVAAGIVYFSDGGLVEASVRALAVFVIACPCALSLAAPLVGLSAAAAASRLGVIIRDLNAATGAAKPTVLFLDKTGTLTEGRPSIRHIELLTDLDQPAVLKLAARAEASSEHPLAQAIVAAAGAQPVEPGAVSRVTPGGGIDYRFGDEKIRVGRLSWIAEGGVIVPELRASDATRVGVAHNGELVGVIELDDPIRPGAAEALRALRSRGVETTILSGDAPGPVAKVAAQLGVDFDAELSPEDKLARVEEAQKSGSVVAFAGDGINDGPALAAADLGIAVATATDAARTAAAISLVDASIADLPALLALTRRTRRIIYQNLAWAVVYNTIAIPAAMAGMVHPAIAAAAMALSSITIVLNATRARVLTAS